MSGFLSGRGLSKADAGKINDIVLQEERRPPETTLDVVRV